MFIEFPIHGKIDVHICLFRKLNDDLYKYNIWLNDIVCKHLWHGFINCLSVFFFMLFQSKW